jgi:modification methylase
MSPHRATAPARQTRRTRDQGCPATQPRPLRRARVRTRSPYRTADLPLAIWPCAQKTSQWQRHGRYLPESNRHPAKMLPALARRAIETYSDPGDLILDPMCGIGTTLVEAIHAGRRAVGVELEARWAKLARANIEHAHQQGASSPAHVIEGDARRAPWLLTDAQHRQVELIVTSPPYACEIAGVSTENLTSRSGPIRRVDTTNYSADRSNLGHARGNAYLAAMAEVYSASVSVLRPGGFLVLVTKDMRCGGALRNLSGQTITLCESLGLRYWQRVIGLLAAVRDDEIVMRPSLWQILAVRRARARGERTHVVAHEDVLVFRKPEPSRSSHKPKGVRREPKGMPARTRSAYTRVHGEVVGSP